MSFETLSLHPSICKSVTDAGYTTPTLIQERAIPVILEGKDILASAQTGTGKTAAFILPVLQRLTTPSAITKTRGARVLVLTPTRELAQQVSDCARNYGRHFPELSVVSIVGGVPYERQRRKMSRAVDIMVATPGRLMDYMRQGKFDLSRVEVLILDEADRMLDMGFRDDVIQISESLPKNRQTLLFSATIDSSIEKIAQRLLRDPVRIEITPQRTRHESIDQKILYVRDLPAKKRMLVELLRGQSVGQAIIFTATKRAADQLTYQLHDEGFTVSALHGDLRQRQRMRTIGELQDGELQFLVATDIAARGIDVRTVSHIFNFDLPRGAEDYVHRIGRTGRAGEKGTAISIAYPYERKTVRRIESFIGHQIEEMKMPTPAHSGAAQAATVKGEAHVERSADAPAVENEFRKPRAPREEFGEERRQHGRSQNSRGAKRPFSGGRSGGSRFSGARTDSTRTGSARTGGARSGGSRTGGGRSYDSRSGDNRARGSFSNDNRAGDSRSTDNRPTESRFNGNRSNDNRAHESRSGGENRSGGSRFGGAPRGHSSRFKRQGQGGGNPRRGGRGGFSGDRSHQAPAQ